MLLLTTTMIFVQHFALDVVCAGSRWKVAYFAVQLENSMPFYDCCFPTQAVCKPGYIYTQQRTSHLHLNGILAAVGKHSEAQSCSLSCILMDAPGAKGPHSSIWRLNERSDAGHSSQLCRGLSTRQRVEEEECDEHTHIFHSALTHSCPV